MLKLQVHQKVAVTEGVMVGRKIMDMFMDKLAQKLNAQEIIKANTTAETEELNKLRSRVAEYSECLDKLSALLESSSEKLESAQVDNEDVKSRTESIQNAVDEVKVLAEGNFGDIKALTQDVEAMLKESMEKIEAMQQGVEAIAASSGDAVHKECVKVYRNVQAVVVEEGAKQTEGLESVNAKVNSVKGKAGAALGISIVTLILVLCSVAMQVLQLLNIKLF